MRNIVLSVFLHAMVITAAFATGITRTEEHVRGNCLVVSLFSQMTGTSPMISEHTRRYEDRILSPSSPAPQSVMPAAESIKGMPIDSLNQNAAPPQETGVSYIGADNVAMLSLHPFNETGNEGSPVRIDCAGNECLSATHESAGDIRYFYDVVRAAIKKAMTYPYPARRQKMEGTVIIMFTINRKGYPQGIRVEKSSGHEILDSWAVRIVMKAAPFPEGGGKIVKPIVIPITFKLTDY